MAKQAERHFRLTEWIAIRGLNLIEQDSGINREDHDRHLMGNKSRLLQLAGFASRYDSKRKKDSRHAMSLMGDAVAALNEADPLFAHAEHAVIDLRRAEVRLTEASAIELFGYYPFEIWTLDRLIGPGINVPIEQNADRSGFQSPHPKTQVEIAHELKQAWQKMVNRNARRERPLNGLITVEGSPRFPRLKPSPTSLEILSSSARSTGYTLVPARPSAMTV